MSDGRLLRGPSANAETLDSAVADPLPTAMEHRLGTRIPLSLPVRLHKEGEAAALGRVINVSLSGAYVATSRDYPLLSRVDIVWGGCAEARAGVSAIAAYLIRKEVDGVALEWCEFAPPAIRRLVALARTWRRARVTLGRGNSHRP